MTKRSKAEIVEDMQCDGCCYGCNTDLPLDDPNRKGMCPLVDVCEATREKEFRATVIGAAMATVLFIASFIFVALLVIGAAISILILFIKWVI